MKLLKDDNISLLNQFLNFLISCKDILNAFLINFVIDCCILFVKQLSNNMNMMKDEKINMLTERINDLVQQVRI